MAKIPRGERPVVRYFDKDRNEVFLMTRNAIGDQFCLYEKGDDGDYTRLGKGKSPADLEEKYKVADRMG